MKKTAFVVPLLLASFLVSCGETDSPSPSSSDTPSSSIALKEFEGASFQSQTITYDGLSHTLPEASGLPAGTNVTYENREPKTDVGSYKAKAVISKEGYKTLTLEATLTILPAKFQGLLYEGKTVYYDGKDHLNDVQVTGVRPTGTTVTETVKNKKGQVVSLAIEVGVYTYEAVITNPNFVPLTLTSTLIIKTNKKDMPVYAGSNGAVYFANGLHNSFLYRYDASNGLKRVDTSSPKSIKRSGTGATFIAHTPFINAAKSIDDTNAVSTLYTETGMNDFVAASEDAYYYSCSSLYKEKRGIYKVSGLSDEEPTVTKIYENAASSLTLYDEDLYFIDQETDFLYKLDLSSLSATSLTTEKLHEFVLDGDYAYCAVNGAINDYIGRLSLSSPSSIEKLTDASGEYLTIKNNALYYNYVDWFAKVDPSRLGIWKIDLATKRTTQILNKGSVNGFDVVGPYSIYYIDTNDYHLYHYDLISQSSSDLLKDFVAPEGTPLNIGGETIVYGDTVYYLNMYAGKTLWAYEETTGNNYQVTTDKVMDFFIEGDNLYFNSVSLLVNNDLFVIGLKDTKGASRVSTYDIRDMASDGTYIYSVHYNAMGLPGGLSRMRMDGSEYIKFSDVNNAKNLVLKDSRLYFINAAISNGDIEYISLSSITLTVVDLKGTKVDEENIKNVKQFLIDGDNLFYIYEGTTTHAIYRTSLSSLGKGTAIASSKTHPIEMLAHGDYIYYYSHPLTLSVSSSGFYRVKKNAAKDGTYTLLAGYESKYYATSLAMSKKGYLYFLNYIPSQVVGDAHTYRLNVANGTIQKIA